MTTRAMVDVYSCEVLKSRVWDKVPEGGTLICGDTRITFQHSVGIVEGSLY